MAHVKDDLERAWLSADVACNLVAVTKACWVTLKGGSL